MIKIEKINDLTEHLRDWAISYQNESNNINAARKALGAVCRIAILNHLGEVKGTNLILGKDLSSVPKLSTERTNKKKWGTLLEADLIDAVEELRIIPKSEPIHGLRLDLLRVLASPESHDNLENILPEKRKLQLEESKILLQRLVNWLFESVLKVKVPDAILELVKGRSDITSFNLPDEEWENFFHACNRFEIVRNDYILVAPADIESNTTISQALCKLPWSLVVDLNPDSEIKGLLATRKLDLGTEPIEITAEPGDVMSLSKRFQGAGSRAQFWFFANGRSNSANQIPTDNLRTWSKKYGLFFGNQLYPDFTTKRLKSGAKQRVVVFFHVDPIYVVDIIKRIDNQEDNASFVVVTNYKDRLVELTRDGYETLVSIIELPYERFSTGVFKSQKDSQLQDNEQIVLPARNNPKGQILSISDYEWFTDIGIEVLHINAGKKHTTTDSQFNFYRGHTITYSELFNEKDIFRTKIKDYEEYIRKNLQNLKGVKTETLYHVPGAGGTTFARRIAFGLHYEFPTIILRRFTEPGTINSIIKMIELDIHNTPLPILIICEEYEIGESNVIKLTKSLERLAKNVFILCVKRLYSRKTKDHKLYLDGQLDSTEIERFKNVYTELSTEKRAQIANVEITYRSQPEFITPFIYGLTAFENSFKRIDNFIEQVLGNLSTEQKQFVGYVCLIYRFTQMSVPAGLFTYLFGFTRADIDLHQKFPESPMFSILYEEIEEDSPSGYWRPRHHLIAETCTEIILAGNTNNRDKWTNKISSWIARLINIFKNSSTLPTTDVLDILEALLIRRDNIDYAGQAVEKNRRSNFARIFEMITPESGSFIFKELVNTYPEVAHFHSHYARFLASRDIKNYDEALKEADLALQIAPDDFNIHHVKGMCYREKVEELLNSTNSSQEFEIQKLTDLACESFKESRRINPDNLHAHTAEMQLLPKVLDYGRILAGNKSRTEFLANPINKWYDEKLDLLFSLLDDAQYILEQRQSYNTKTIIDKSLQFIVECEGNLYELLGDFSKAKEKFRHQAFILGSEFKNMRPHFRRLYIYSTLGYRAEKNNLKHRNEAWRYITNGERTEIKKALEDNIIDEPDNSLNVKLWLFCVRYSRESISIDICIDRLATLKQNSLSIVGRVEINYYLYVLNAIMAIDKGISFDLAYRNKAQELLLEQRENKTQNDIYCFEWYGKGLGINKMVVHSEIGLISDGVIRNTEKLQEVTGQIDRINSRQEGTITLDCGLKAFFVPVRGGFDPIKDEKKRVKFFVGFRYDRLQAWNVIFEKQERNILVSDQDVGPTINIEVETVETTERNIEAEVESEKEMAENTTSAPKLPGLKVVGFIDPSQFDNKKKKKN